MKSGQIRMLTAEEIETQLRNAEEELFNLRFQLSIGQLENHNRLSELRRDIARLTTIRHERELQIGPSQGSAD